MKQLKRTFTFVFVAVLTVGFLFEGMCTTVKADPVQPFLLNVPAGQNELTDFDISIQLSGTYAVAAFDLLVTYDASVLELDNSTGTGYAYTDAFLKDYAGGSCSAHQKDASTIAFSGAKSGAQPFDGTIAVLHFKVLDNCKAAKTAVVLYTKTAGVETEQGTKRLDILYPQLTYEFMIRYIKGDINLDGSVDLKDAQLALKVALKIVNKNDLSDVQLRLGDVTGSGNGIDLKDAQAILKKALKIPIQFDE